LNNNLILKLSILLISILLFWSLKDFFLLIICSLVISNIVCNLCSKLKKLLKISRPISLLLVWLTLTIIFFISIVLVLPPFIKEFNEILVDIPNALTRLNLIINSNIDKVNKILYGEETENIFEILQIFNNSISLPDGATIAKAIQESFINIINLAGNLGSGFIRLIFVLVVSLMISIEPNSYKEGILIIIPKQYRNKSRKVFDKCNIALSNWMFSMIVSSISVGILSLIVLSILNVKYIVSNAILAMVLNIIPNIGPVISGIFPISIALLDNLWKPLLVLIGYIIIQNIESYIIMPSILKKKTSLLPGLTLISQFGFTFIFGPLGLILSLPLAVVAQVIIKEYVQNEY
tara:strand:- start:6145 stop:7191 length:1047 start_codon:yes stop_codon:yes gene_type:complete